MAFVHANLVLETTTTEGNGTLTLAGLVTGHLTFAAEVGVGNTCAYSIEASNGQKETGIGTVGTGTLERTTLISSSTGSKLVLPAGTHYVGVTANSESFTPAAIGAATTATKLDDFAAPDDNQDLDASTSTHGLAPKAVAPAAGLLSVIGIANGETVYTNKTLPDLGVSAQASENIAAGDLVNLYTATGALRVQKADASGTTKPAHGYAQAAITSGNSGSIYALGTVVGLSGLTPGGDCWLSQATAGAVTQTAPDETTAGKLIQIVGKALTASTMLFQPGPAIIT